MTWKSAGASREGRARISGQLPEPESSAVHVIGSPAFTCTGTIFDVILKSPTAPLKPLGAGGRGLTWSDTGAPGTANCWYWRCWKKPNSETPTLRLISWLVVLSGM